MSFTSRELDQAINAILAADYALIEQTCERAIQGGVAGVRIERVNGKLISCSVDDTVPYGRIYEHLHSSAHRGQHDDHEDYMCEMIRMMDTTTFKITCT